MSQDREQKFLFLESESISGRGYSSDSQYIVSSVCYNVTSSPPGLGTLSIKKLDAPMSFASLQRELNIDVSTKGKSGMFYPSPEANYVRAVQETGSSFSLNYYYLIYRPVYVQVVGFGIGALTPFGKSFYHDGNNKIFNVFCGDEYISSHKEGSLLIFSIAVELRNNYEKSLYQGSFTSVNGANIYNVSTRISEVALQNNIFGSVSIKAFQKGGDQLQLSSVLAKDPKGDYYSLSCDLRDMGSCINVANGLFDYALNSFAVQTFYGIGRVPLGASFITTQPISSIGLRSTACLATSAVTSYRIELAAYLEENQYYQQKLESLIKYYPVTWDVESAIYRSSNSLLVQAQNNIDVLMNPVTHQGANGCFEFPEECEKIISGIRVNLQPITTNDLSWLYKVQYYYEFSDSSGKPFSVYRTGDSNSSWKVTISGNVSTEYFAVTPTILNSRYSLCDVSKCSWITINCNAIDEAIKYSCSAVFIDALMHSGAADLNGSRYTSAFFFDPYVHQNITKALLNMCDGHIPAPSPYFEPAPIPKLVISVDPSPSPEPSFVGLPQPSPAPFPGSLPQPIFTPKYVPYQAPVSHNLPVPITIAVPKSIVSAPAPTPAMPLSKLNTTPVNDYVESSWDHYGLLGLLGIIPATVALVAAYGIYKCYNKPATTIGEKEFSVVPMEVVGEVEA